MANIWFCSSRAHCFPSLCATFLLVTWCINVAPARPPHGSRFNTRAPSAYSSFLRHKRPPLFLPPPPPPPPIPLLPPPPPPPIHRMIYNPPPPPGPAYKYSSYDYYDDEDSSYGLPVVIEGSTLVAPVSASNDVDIPSLEESELLSLLKKLLTTSSGYKKKKSRKKLFAFPGSVIITQPAVETRTLVQPTSSNCVVPASPTSSDNGIGGTPRSGFPSVPDAGGQIPQNPGSIPGSVPGQSSAVMPEQPQQTSSSSSQSSPQSQSQSQPQQQQQQTQLPLIDINQVAALAAMLSQPQPQPTPQVIPAPILTPVMATGKGGYGVSFGYGPADYGYGYGQPTKVAMAPGMLSLPIATPVAGHYGQMEKAETNSQSDELRTKLATELANLVNNLQQQQQMQQQQMQQQQLMQQQQQEMLQQQAAARAQLEQARAQFQPTGISTNPGASLPQQGRSGVPTFDNGGGGSPIGVPTGNSQTGVGSQSAGASVFSLVPRTIITVGLEGNGKKPRSYSDRYKRIQMLAQKLLNNDYGNMHY